LSIIGTSNLSCPGITITFFLPVKALSKIFRAKFIELALKDFSEIVVAKYLWKKEWVVYSRPGVFGAEKILEYLSRYISKIAITNNRIIAEKDGIVTFKYKNSKDNKWKIMNLDAIEFIRRYLQHVLYKGFHKIRYYGLFSPSNKRYLKQIQFSLALKNKELKNSESNTSENNIKNTIDHKCTECQKGYMIIIKKLPRLKTFYYGRSPPC